MRTHRIYTSGTLDVGTDIVLDGKAAHYVSRVLRLPENAEAVLFNGDGFDYRCKLFDFKRDRILATVLEQLPNESASPLQITLAQAMSRGDRMDYSLQKATELGVSAVQLLDTERVELKLAGNRLEKRLAHWRGVIESACEQCGRATLPELHDPIALSVWVDQPGQKLVLDASGEQKLSQLTPESTVSIAVGPEGGFADSELDLMKHAKVQPVRMGPRILRTETAGPAAIALIQAKSGDF